MKLTHAAALAIVRLFESLMKKQRVVYSQKLVKTVMDLTFYIRAEKGMIQHKIDTLYDIFK